MGLSLDWTSELIQKISEKENELDDAKENLQNYLEPILELYGARDEKIEDVRIKSDLVFIQTTDWNWNSFSYDIPLSVFISDDPASELKRIRKYTEDSQRQKRIEQLKDELDRLTREK